MSQGQAMQSLQKSERGESVRWKPLESRRDLDLVLDG